ncbi:class I SAM-dependent methyltransferase [Rhizobium sp. AC44/96]|uniref:class I SAM-dependent methyltransferase n=1 Tax=Rhizobium sp. AC44/96 TaxID=1841654 RepID=UPI00080F8080|nr:class I SAM-dependent methyltransferase [Rhizobium sp. AC44/96]
MMQDDSLQAAGVADFRKLVETSGFDHIDFGCSKGGSLALAKKRFDGRRGLGIDIDPSKIEQTLAAGYDAILYDIHNIPDEKLVRFVIMSHFLEHVPNLKDVRAFVRKACMISSDFVYIQQPYFDADSYLFERGFKLYWSDWFGHRNQMTSLELWLMLRDLQKEGLPITFSLHAHKPITNSVSPRIHPLASPKNQHDYAADVHPPKDRSVRFQSNVFHELICLITFPGCDHAEQLKKLRYHHTIIDSSGKPAKVKQHNTLDRVKQFVGLGASS